MEQFYIIDEETAGIFSELHPQDPEEWFKSNTMALGVVSDGKPSALLVTSFAEETIWLDWLYVKEEYRKKGIGGMVLYRLIDCINGFGDLYLYTACSTEMKEFLDKMGFEFPLNPSYSEFRAPLSGVAKLPSDGESDNIRSLYDISDTELNQLNNILIDPSLESVGIRVPVDIKAYQKESSVYIEDDKIKAMLFLQKVNDTINISYAYSASAKDGAKLIHLFSHAKKLIKDHYGADIEISATSLNEKSEKLISTLLPDAEKTDFWEGKRVLI